MGSDEQSDRVTDDAQGTSGRTGQSLGELTEERGDPVAKRLDLDEPPTAPLHDPSMTGRSGQEGAPEEEGNTERESDTARTGIATTPEATEQISEVARSADFGDEQAPG